ncbi:hypothetical protein [Stenotrophomonas maltophilia]|uniref:hypothetical protein n=1 Tax=Stenotrophomonas maltophilia TaxID=40324 RepID=UPI0015DF51D7|nr:hypothetical protein [Stenotrophomonas maltophilia]
MVTKLEIHNEDIADEFLASLVANGERLEAAEFHASDKIHDPDVRKYFLERARQLLQA